MNRAWRWRFAFALVTGAAAACVPILGLDDLEPAPKDAGTEASGDTGTEAGDAADLCTTHAECVDRAFNDPARCVKNHCVTVNKSLCNQQVLPDLNVFKREDTIVVAAFIPGATANTGAGKAYSLALEEIEKAGGILGAPRRHLALLVCDADPELAEESLKHAIEEFQVPAIIAAFGTGKLAELVAGKAANAGVFTMNPTFTTEYLKGARVNRRVWGLLGTGEDVALAYRPVLERLREEKQIRPDAKIALVATDGSLHEPMADLLEFGQVNTALDGGVDPTKALAMVDGATPKQDPDHFKRFLLKSPEITPDLAVFNASVQELKNDLLAFEPDVIIAMTDSELDAFIVDIDDTLSKLYAGRADAGLDAGEPGGAPQRGPWWILGPANGHLIAGGKKTSLGNYIDPDAGGADKRRERIIGVQFAGALDQEAYAEPFRDRLVVKYKDAAVEGFASENYYDAIYWLAYGIVAAGPDAPVNGDSFSLGVRLLFKGSIEVKPGNEDTVQRAFDQIDNYPQPYGNKFVGALGPPDISEATGTWNSVGSTYCYPPHAQNKPAPTYEVRRYSREDGGGLVPSLKPLTCN